MSTPKNTYFTNKKIIVQFILSLLVFFIHFSVFSVFGNDAPLNRVFNENAISCGWIVDQRMGNCANQLAVLDNG